MKMMAKIEFEVTKEELDDIVCTAMDGGITYWAIKAVPYAMINGKREKEYLGEYASDQISRGGELDITDEEGDVFTLTLNKLVNGIKLYVMKNSKLISEGRLDMWQIDACVADAIVQYALFDEIIYG